MTSNKIFTDFKVLSKSLLIEWNGYETRQTPLLYVFVDLKVHNVQKYHFIVLTNKNVALIYSVTICQQKTKDCALSRYFQHKLQHCCFYH